jgi:membrane protein implicated in regulation of membrane protease activity
VRSRTLVELLHLAAGLVATACITAASAWAYPLGRGVIEAVGWVAAGVVLAMYVDPIRRAWEADQRGSDVR